MRTRCELPLPGTWTESVKSAVLNVIGLARYANTRAAAKAADNPGDLPAENARLRQENLQLREELRIHRARMELVSPHQRPRYPPTERLAILELRAARGWSLEQTARAFLVTAATISSWMRRVDEAGADALVQAQQPVNKFPDFVRYAVQRLKTHSPQLGKQKIAQTLARAGLHLAATTVGRILDEKPATDGDIAPHADGDSQCGATLCSEAGAQSDENGQRAPRVVTAKCINHVWHVDLTVVPTCFGFWCPWNPFAVLQCWPFCWWVAVIVDHYSRRVMGCALFARQPSSEQVRAALGRAIRAAGAAPKYIICDRGPQFDNNGFRDWCQRSRIKPPRYGAIGKHGSIAVVERFILTLKTLLGTLPFVSLHRGQFRHELDLLCEWYNEHRPHTTLGGSTPHEKYFNVRPANRRPRWEPREGWPRGSPCARPWAIVKGQPGTRLKLDLAFHKGRKHLPIVRLNKRTA